MQEQQGFMAMRDARCRDPDLLALRECGEHRDYHATCDCASELCTVESECDAVRKKTNVLRQCTRRNLKE
jgi:hypothetical protein